MSRGPRPRSLAVGGSGPGPSAGRSGRAGQGRPPRPVPASHLLEPGDEHGLHAGDVQVAPFQFRFEVDDAQVGDLLALGVRQRHGRRGGGGRGSPRGRGSRGGGGHFRATERGSCTHNETPPARPAGPPSTRMEAAADLAARRRRAAAHLAPGPPRERLAAGGPAGWGVLGCASAPRSPPRKDGPVLGSARGWALASAGSGAESHEVPRGGAGGGGAGPGGRRGAAGLRCGGRGRRLWAGTGLRNRCANRGCAGLCHSPLLVSLENLRSETFTLCSCGPVQEKVTLNKCEVTACVHQRTGAVSAERAARGAGAAPPLAVPGPGWTGL